MTEPARDGAEFRRELLAVLPHLRAFARGLCGRPDYADDLVQETAARALANADRFTPGTSMRAWTFVILRNRFLSELRRDRGAADIDGLAPGDHPAVDGDQEDSVHLSDMNRALQRLRPERREALLLVGAGGFSYEEAARIAGCALGTMKSRVARGRADLAALLGMSGAV